MDQISEVTKSLTRINLVRDFNYIISGIFVLVISNYIFKPDFDTFPNILYFGAISRHIGLIIVAYFLSRFFCELGDFLLKFGLVLLKIKEVKKIFAEYIKNILGYRDKVQLDFNFDIYNLEVLEYIGNKKEMYCEHERAALRLLYEKVFLGFTFSLFIYFIFFDKDYTISFLSLVVSVCLWFKVLVSSMHLKELFSKIRCILKKERNNIAPF